MGIGVDRFTGSFDKNHKKIFVGDRVKFRENTGTVKFKDNKYYIDIDDNDAIGWPCETWKKIK